MPEFASSNRVGIRYVAEVTWGDLPASPIFQNIRHTGETLKHNKQTIVSNEVRSDRQIDDTPEVGVGADGDINFELSYGAYDDFIRGALQSTWDTDTFTGAGTLDNFSFEADPYNTIRGPGLEAFSVGQWVKVEGATQSANNGYFHVLGKNANLIVVDGPLVTEAGSTATVRGSMIRNGSIETSFSIEKEFADIVQFLSFNGMEVSQMQLAIQARAIVTGSFSFMGSQGSALYTTTKSTGGTALATSTADVLNGTANAGTVLEGGVALVTSLQQINITMANALREQSGIGSKGAVGIGTGRFAASGTMRAYFANATLYNKFFNHSASSLHFRLTDLAGNALLFTLPKLKFTTDPVAGGGIDQDVIEDIGYQALRDPVTDCTMQIDRFAA